MTLNLKNSSHDRTNHALLKIWSFLIFKQTHPECQIESKVTSGRQKKIDGFSVDGICYHCNTVFETMGCYFHYCPCQEARPSLTDGEIMRGKKGNKTKCAKNISNRKDTKLKKCESASGGNYTELMQQYKIIFEQISPINDLSTKNDSCKRLGVENCLVKFNATSKFLNTRRHTLPTFPKFSKILL